MAAGTPGGFALTDEHGVFVLVVPAGLVPDGRIQLVFSHPDGDPLAAELGLLSAPDPAADRPEEPAARAAWTLAVAHESGVPIAGVPNRYVARAIDERGAAVAAGFRISGLGKAELRAATGPEGAAAFEWDPAESGGYCARGFAPGPVARIIAEDGSGRVAEARFDPMRPRPGAPAWWRPDPERALRGADGPARFLVRPRFDPARPEIVELDVAAPQPGGWIYLLAFGQGRLLAVRDVAIPEDLPARLELPAAVAAPVEIRALRVMPDGAVAFDRRWIGTAGPGAGLAAPPVRFLSTAAEAEALAESARADAEEELRTFHAGLRAAAACAGGVAMLALLWWFPGRCLKLRWGTRAAGSWWAGTALALGLSLAAAAKGWLPKGWRLTGPAAVSIVLVLGAAAAYAAALRHTRRAAVGLALIGVLAAAAWWALG